MRIAIDTSVLIAALTKPRGAAARIVGAWREGALDAVASEATCREAELVLGGRWLAQIAGSEDVRALLRDLRERAVRVAPQRIAGLSLKDAGDRHLIEAAVAGDARYLVTADRELLRVRGYAGVEFVTPAEFCKREAIGQ